MKKLFLSLSLCLAAITSAQATDWTDDNGVTWSYSLINDNTEVRITGVSNYPTDLTVPATIDGKTVTQLGEPNGKNNYYAPFYGKTDITSVTLPSTVTNIGLYAFSGCSNLASVDLSSCTSIGRNAFYNCTSVASVGDLSSCESIGESAFLGCTSLASVGDLSSCTSIGNYAFLGCTSLASVGDLSSCKSIGESAFSGCTSLASVGDLSYCKSIGVSAFQGCASLASVGDLSSCTSIGVSAFYGCAGLESVGDLSSCTNIGIYAFYGCAGLESVGDLSSCTSIGDYAFSGCACLASVGDLSSCTSIGNYAFSGCACLASVDLSSCTSIGNYAFSSCSSLASVGDLSSCTSIGSNAFYNCTKLTSVGDLSACTSIGGSAFSGCTSLASVGDLSSCTSIGGSAFYDCASLKRVYVSSVIPPVLAGTNAFMQCTTVIVPADNLDDYRTANVWKDMAVRIIADNVQTEYDVTGLRAMDQGSTLQDAIGEANLGNVIDLKMSGSINGYDIMVMRNKMHNLHTIDMKDVNIVANDYCYYGSYHTTDNVLGEYAFQGMTKLSKVTTPSSITSIGFGTFSHCDLTEVILTPGVKTIGTGAFSGLYYGNHIDIPEGVTYIGSSAFEGSSSYVSRLVSVNLPASLEQIGSDAFRYCRSLETVTIPNNSRLKVISNNAFFSCESLKSFNLPSNLIELGDAAFRYCPLTEITLPSSLQKIGSNAFQYCPLTEIRATAVEASSVSISQITFDASAYQTATLYLPYDEETGWNATYNSYYWNTQWSQFANLATWKPNYSSISVESDYLQEIGTIPGEEIDASFGSSSGYVLGEEAEQSFDDVHIKHEGNNGGSIIADEDNLEINNLHIDINVTKGKWYFFAFPFNVALANVEAPGNFVFREYDGKERADNGRGGWKNLPKDQTYLYAGKGYIFQTNTTGVLTLPVEHPDFSALKEELALDTHSAANTQDASWNFVGNPFLSYYDIDEIDFDAPITIWNGSGYEAVRPGDDDYKLYPYQAFFVQKPSAAELAQIGFDLTQQETKSGKKAKSDDTTPSSVAARRMAKGANSNRMLINLMVSDGTYTDKTRVVFNDESSMDYEMTCDAAKFMSSENVPQLYSTYNNVNYQINERPNGSREVSLGFTAKQNGTYTIEAARMDVPMALKDLVTGIVFDLSDGAYSFESQAGTFDNRFVLMDMSKAPTGIEGVEDASHYAKAYDLNGRQLQQPQQGVQLKEGKKVVVM